MVENMETDETQASELPVIKKSSLGHFGFWPWRNCRKQSASKEVGRGTRTQLDVLSVCVAAAHRSGASGLPKFVSRHPAGEILASYDRRVRLDTMGHRSYRTQRWLFCGCTSFLFSYFGDESPWRSGLVVCLLDVRSEKSRVRILSVASFALANVQHLSG